MPRLSCVVVSVLIATVVVTSPLTAATDTWAGAVNNLWSVGANWVGGSAPSSGDDLVFPDTASLANRNTMNDMAGLNVNSIKVSGSNYNFAGNAISIGAGGVNVTAPTNTSLTFAGITLSASQTWAVSSVIVTVGPTNINGQTLTLAHAFSFHLQSMSGGGAILQTGSGTTNLIFSTYTGTITVSNGQFVLQGGTAGDLSITGGGLVGLIAASVGNITVNSGGALVYEMFFGNQTSGNLTLSADSTIYYLTQPGIVPVDNVTGTVTLGGARFKFGPSGTFSPGTTITFINNDGTDAVNGTFFGLPEGSIINGGQQSFQISYTGGTGNDVTFTVLAATAAGTTTTVTSSSNPSTVGQSVTFTATVTSGSGTPSGTVMFFDGTTFLGSATLNGAGQATFTTNTLTLGTHTITAAFSSNSSFAASEGVVVQTMMTFVPLFGPTGLALLLMAIGAIGFVVLRR